MGYAVRDESSRVEKRSSSAALKFTVVYTENFNRLKNSSIIKAKIIQRAIDFWQKTLTVKDTSNGKILVQRFCDGGTYNQLVNGTIFCWQTQCRQTEKCGDFKIPTQYLTECLKMNNRNELTTVYQKGEGLEAHGYLLFVDSQNTGSCIYPSTNAYASACQMDPVTDSKTTVKQITRKWVSAAGTFNKTFPALVTENIIKEAKSHFQCQSVDGVDLENEGSSGSYGSHLEGRVYSMELMAASSEVEAFASRVTLAYFVDSGWYTVNFKLADKWNYAKGYGCGFALGSCYHFASQKRKRHESIKPYCDEPNVVACRDLYTYGLCDVYPYPLPLPPADQFFGPEAGRNYNRLGGSNVFKDKCPTLSYTCKPGGDIDIDFSGQTVTCKKDEKDKTGKFVLDGKTYEVKIRCPNSKVLCKSSISTIALMLLRIISSAD
ncbi:unnamed protein product [Trichobilharzia szidati]|nr:unnamed protein product [Trichobilharzia szidati]